MDPDEDVGNCDKLEVCLLGIGEEHLWLPDGFHKSRVGQVHRRLDVRMGESRVIPLLSQVGVCSVVLKI